MMSGATVGGTVTSNLSHSYELQSKFLAFLSRRSSPAVVDGAAHGELPQHDAERVHVASGV